MILFVICGGMKAITSTDNLQMALLLIGIIILGPIMITRYLVHGGYSLAQLPADFLRPTNGTNTGSMLALALSTIMCIFVSMDSYTRCIAARNAKSARRGAVLAALGCLLLGASATYMGLAGKVALPDIDSNSCVAAAIVHFFPSGLLLVGVICAIISSADILILVGAANLCNDIYQRHINPGAGGKKFLHMNTGASILVGLAAAVLGWRSNNSIDILLVSYTINAAGCSCPWSAHFSGAGAALRPRLHPCSARRSCA